MGPAYACTKSGAKSGGWDPTARQAKTEGKDRSRWGWEKLERGEGPRTGTPGPRAVGRVLVWLCLTMEKSRDGE